MEVGVPDPVGDEEAVVVDDAVDASAFDGDADAPTVNEGVREADTVDERLWELEALTTVDTVEEDVGVAVPLPVTDTVELGVLDGVAVSEAVLLGVEEGVGDTEGVEEVEGMAMAVGEGESGPLGVADGVLVADTLGVGVALTGAPVGLGDALGGTSPGPLLLMFCATPTPQTLATVVVKMQDASSTVAAGLKFNAAVYVQPRVPGAPPPAAAKRHEPSSTAALAL